MNSKVNQPHKEAATFADISATASEYFNVDKTGLGKSFLSEILIDGN